MPDLPPIGGHVSAAGGLKKAVERAQAEGFDALQLFTQSPRAWAPTDHGEEAFSAYRDAYSAAGLRYAACHALYLINLASADPDLSAKSERALVATVRCASAMGLDGVVLHVGSHGGEGFAVGLDRCLAPLQTALAELEGPTRLLLESSAGQGGTLGRDVQELAALVDRLDRHPRLGVCLDSCHLYVSGIDVGDEEVVATLAAEVEQQIGLDRVGCLHVNDSQGPLGSNRDRHANILEGLIGESLRAFVNHPAFRQLPALLETPGVERKGPSRFEADKLRALYA